MSETLTSRDTYSIGVDYEVIRDGINDEIGYQTNAARRAGYESASGQRHLALAKRYGALLRTVSARDRVGLEGISAGLASARLSREQVHSNSSVGS